MQLVGGEKNKGVQVVSEEKNENSEDKREPFWSVRNGTCRFNNKRY